MKKRILSCLMALALCLTLLPTAAFAADSTDAWDGTADTSWYVGHETDTEYHFTTAEQLAGLAQLVNDKTASVSFERKTIYLDNDLDLSGTQWTPIGNGDNFVRHFAGTFDGQYHKIMNLYHHSTGDELIRNGLFGVVSDGGTLKNLLVIDADIASNDGSLLAGILADWVNGGTVENCYTSGRIENNVGDKMVGGLIGQCTWSTQVKGCGSDATVISTESDEDHVDTVGGLIGQWENSADSSSITDCWFGGSVSCNNIYSAVGGILGANFENFIGNRPGVIIKNCIVATKNITGAEPGNITWITAAVNIHVTDCIWPDKTVDENYYLLTLAAIAKEIAYRNAPTATSVILAAGLPLTSFGREKKAFRAYLLREGKPVSFSYEGISYETSVQDVKLFPQGYAAILQHSDLLNEPSVILADIGGWTVDIMRLDNRIPHAASCRSLELGMIRCLDEIAEQVRRSLNLSLTSVQIENVLRGIPDSMDDRVKAIIQREAGLYARRILSAIAEAGLDCRAMPVVFLGGGAGLMKRYLPQGSVLRPVILDDDKLNAQAYERLAGQVADHAG